MTEQDYNTMPLGELEKMVSGMSVADMDTSKPAEPKPEEESKPDTEPESKDAEEEKEQPKEEEQKEDEQPEKEEKEEKKTPESIKKLLHQRSELRQDNDRLRSELAEAQELVKKLRS